MDNCHPTTATLIPGAILDTCHQSNCATTDLIKLKGTRLEYLKGIGHNLAARLTRIQETTESEDEDPDGDQSCADEAPDGDQSCAPAPPQTSSSFPPLTGRHWVTQKTSELGLVVQDIAGGGNCLFMRLETLSRPRAKFSLWPTFDLPLLESSDPVLHTIKGFSRAKDPERPRPLKNSSTGPRQPNGELN